MRGLNSVGSEIRRGSEAHVTAVTDSSRRTRFLRPQLLMFCDAHRHTAFNNTDKTRIILQIDVIRPEYQCIENWISARVLASILTQKISIWVLPVIRGRWYLYRIVYYALMPFLYVCTITQFGAGALFDFLLDKTKK